jgi:hypothetical protein
MVEMIHAFCTQWSSQGKVPKFDQSFVDFGEGEDFRGVSQPFITKKPPAILGVAHDVGDSKIRYLDML